MKRGVSGVRRVEFLLRLLFSRHGLLQISLDLQDLLAILPKRQASPTIIAFCESEKVLLILPGDGQIVRGRQSPTRREQ
jgi:hypothetical protein